MLSGLLRHTNRSYIVNQTSILKLNASTSVLFKNKLPNEDLKVAKEVSNNNAVLDKTKLKLFELMSIYEEAIGIKEIKNAQQSVLEAEKNFVTAQQSRRDLNLKLIEVQSRLRSLRDEMDRLNRSDSRYLQLFTEEHNILKNEINLMNEYKLKEDEERQLFFTLSTNLRDSQEKERTRVESIKYLQLGLSIACTLLGILSAYLLNYFRNSNIKEVLRYNKEQFEQTHMILNNLVNKNQESEINLCKKIDSLMKKPEETLKRDDKKITQPDESAKALDIPRVKQTQEDIIKPDKKSYVQSQIPPIRINPYILSGAAVVGFICYLANK